MSWTVGCLKLKEKKDDRESELGQTFGYKPLSDFGPLGRNRALPSCHSSLYQQRDEEPSSLERGGRAQRQETIREKEGRVEEKTDTTGKRPFYSMSIERRKVLL